MIYIFDTYYTDSYAHTAVVGIEDWLTSEATFELSEVTRDVNDYESGSFYKRELPCLLSIIEKMDIDTTKDVLVVDGYVILSDEGKLGLGGYLFKALKEKIPVVGVAKNDFVSLVNGKREIFRGESKKGLYVTSMGIDLEKVSEYILHMDGKYRIPTILKLVDQNSRMPINDD